jgi:hypothetical protein
MTDNDELSMTDLQQLIDDHAVFGNDTEWRIGIILFYGSWNALPIARIHTLVSRLVRTALRKQGYQNCHIFGRSIQVDQNDDDLAQFIGEKTQSNVIFSSVSSELPILSVLLQQRSQCSYETKLHHISNISSSDIIQFLKMPTMSFDSPLYMSKILYHVQRTVEDIETKYSLDINYWNSSSDALRIFVAGDRSSVGKSSICLGIIGSLLASGYTPDTLAYIKPATQSESTQLIQLYCDQHGIQCIPIGPLVYYRGFTRAFLAGQVGSTEEWLDRCGRAVDRIARGKRIVVIDGVGFPSVGSICGTSNAAVAKACGYLLDRNNGIRRRPMGVLLVGGSGVGAAVDAFNLNAAFFEQSHVPVMGGIFNKLPESGYYSLDNCKEQISAYFRQSAEQVEKGRRPFGFVPLFPRIAGNFALSYVDEYIDMFRTHVDIDAIIQAAQQHKESSSLIEGEMGYPSPKRIKLSASTAPHIPVVPVRSRQEIEAEAITSGAAPSA